MAEPKVRIQQVRTFEGDGFAFTFPEFEGWEVKAVQKKSPDLAIIFIHWPDTIEFEVAPQTAVRKVPGLTPTAGQSTQWNRNRVMYARVYDPSWYVQGHAPLPGEWDHLEFYGPSFGVRITPFRHDGDGYDSAALTAAIADSFRFLP